VILYSIANQLRALPSFLSLRSGFLPESVVDRQPRRLVRFLSYCRKHRWSPSATRNSSLVRDDGCNESWRNILMTLAGIWARRGSTGAASAYRYVGLPASIRSAGVAAMRHPDRKRRRPHRAAGNVPARHRIQQQRIVQNIDKREPRTQSRCRSGPCCAGLGVGPAAAARESQEDGKCLAVSCKLALHRGVSDWL
jgi:hypothetical protein